MTPEQINECPFCGATFTGNAHPDVVRTCPLMQYKFTNEEWAVRPKYKLADEKTTAQTRVDEIEYMRSLVYKLLEKIE